MTLNEIIYTIRESLRRYTVDSTVDDREIIFQVNLQRALYFRNEFNKNYRDVIETNKQTLCLNLIPYEKDNCVLISNKEIPRFIELHEKPSISRITSSVQHDVPFDIVSFTKLPFVGNGRFNTKNVFVSLTPDSKLIVKSKNKQLSMLNKILVTGVFENPLALQSFKCDLEETQDCFSFDKEYPMSPHTFVYIMQNVVNYFLAKLQIPVDASNNADES
jgi:hypothetical protein